MHANFGVEWLRIELFFFNPLCQRKFDLNVYSSINCYVKYRTTRNNYNLSSNLSAFTSRSVRALGNDLSWTHMKNYAQRLHSPKQLVLSNSKWKGLSSLVSKRKTDVLFSQNRCRDQVFVRLALLSEFFFAGSRYYNTRVVGIYYAFTPNNCIQTT